MAPRGWSACPHGLGGSDGPQGAAKTLRIDAKAVDAKTGEKVGDLRIGRRSLAAHADRAADAMGALDCLS